MRSGALSCGGSNVEDGNNTGGGRSVGSRLGGRRASRLRGFGGGFSRDSAECQQQQQQHEPGTEQQNTPVLGQLELRFFLFGNVRVLCNGLKGRQGSRFYSRYGIGGRCFAHGASWETAATKGRARKTG